MSAYASTLAICSSSGEDDGRLRVVDDGVCARGVDGVGDVVA